MSATIRQEVTIAASPHQVYRTLLDPERFSAFTGGAPAEIEASPGGAFSLFGRMIAGRNIELLPDRRIVQAWRAGNWPEGHYSIVRFELAPDGAGTKLTLEHAGFPEGNGEHLRAGWPKMYWEPLKQYLAEAKA